MRVGTTGDYGPFSIATPGGYVGVDIDLAKDLGRALGRPVIFVSTSWPALVADARAGRFDLAMHGISLTREREVEVDFSIPYHEDARIAVVRCAEQDRFRSFDDLNRPGIVVFANTSGATASYAETHLPNATLRQEPLTLAHQRLAAGEGDAVLSTGYEARRHRNLCIGLGGIRFLVTPIAVLFPRGSNLVDQVNRWLEQRIADGTVERLLEHYGTP